MSSTPRGIHNNNPGNIRWGDPWQGLVPATARTDKDFCQFTTAAWGIRAMCIVLIAYQDKHNLHTVRGIIGRWAPPAENATQAYIFAVSQACAISCDAAIDVHRYATMLPLVKAIITHENAVQPYDATTLEEGLRLAGIVKPVKSPIQTPGGAAVAVAGSTGIAAAITEGYTQVAPVVASLSSAAQGNASVGQWLRIAGGALVVLSIAASLYAYWHHHRALAATRP